MIAASTGAATTGVRAATPVTGTERGRWRPVLATASVLASLFAAGCMPASSSPTETPDGAGMSHLADAQADQAPDLSTGGDAAPGIDHPVASDGGTSDTTPEGGAPPGGDASADAAQFGLATRPTKQTCVAPASVDVPVARLSATGCVDPADPKKPAASMIPYDVISPLWSDGADKQRFLGIPDGTTIHVKNCAREPDTCVPSFQGGTTFDEGHWVLPVGTVLMKNFLFAGRLVETRLFIRFTDTWAGFSYQWNAAQTDAMLVGDTGLTADVKNGSGATQSWYFPARNDCFECHNDAAGSSLGPDSRQLNWSYKYPSGVTANQIDTLEHIGLFDAPVARLPSLVDFRAQGPGSPTLEDKARSYLHANCATCHRPDGNYSSIDLRFGVTLQKMNICNIDPNKGDLGVTGSKRLVPIDPAKSIILLRMKAADKMSGRMPQLATSVLDQTGISLVTSWIQSITSCP